MSTWNLSSSRTPRIGSPLRVTTGIALLLLGCGGATSNTDGHALGGHRAVATPASSDGDRLLEPHLHSRPVAAVDEGDGTGVAIAELGRSETGWYPDDPLRACAVDDVAETLRERLVCPGGDRPFAGASDEQVRSRTIALNRGPEGIDGAVYDADCPGGPRQAHVRIGGCGRSHASLGGEQ